MTLPYPLPQGWRTSSARPLRVWLAALWSVVAAGLVALTLWGLLRADVAQALVCTVLFGCVGLALGIGYERAGSERGMPDLLNAVTLTTAETPPPDDWVHFFRARGPGLWLTVCFAAVGWITAPALGWIGVILLTQGGSAPLLLILVVPLLLGALVITLAGSIAVVSRWRHGSFGRRPMGFALGRHALVYHYLDGVDVWPWEAIADVGASVEAVDRTTGDFEPILVLVPIEGAADLRRQEYHLAGYRSHAWLIYTAVRFWRDRPDLREELSTTVAQRRIQGWRDAMVASSAQRHPGQVDSDTPRGPGSTGTPGVTSP